MVNWTPTIAACQIPFPGLQKQLCISENEFIAFEKAIGIRICVLICNIRVFENTGLLFSKRLAGV